MSADSERERLVNRREAIRRVSAMLGGVAFVGGSGLIAACERSGVPATGASGTFSAADIAFLDEVAETILPATGTPGAKAARTGAFMALMVTDSYSAAEQQRFRDGMRQVDEASRKANGTGFLAATPAQRLTVLEALDREQKAEMDAREAAAHGEAPAHYFRMMKELAMLGFFTSEIGYLQVQRYVERPGRWDPCLPYTPGDRAWASHA